ncbi:MAG: hypothetical protein WD578_02855 [Bacteroidales bacterium]
MKNIFKITVLLALMILSSCETYDPAEPDFSNSYPAYVELANTSVITVPEGGNIQVTLSSRTVIYESYTVSYEITGEYEASGTVLIDGGKSQETVVIPVEAGIVTDASLSATLTLTEVSGGIALGRNGNNLAVDVTITRFVPFVQDDYAIAFNCNEPGYGDYLVDFVATDVDHVLTNTNFWDSGWEIDYSFSADFDQKVIIDPQVQIYGDTPLTISGSGSYDGVTRTIVVDYTVVDDTGGVWDNNTHTFTVPD